MLLSKVICCSNILFMGNRRLWLGEHYWRESHFLSCLWLQATKTWNFGVAEHLMMDELVL